MTYSAQQIEAVREMQHLHGIPGHISDENCKKYLDWWHSSQTAKARGAKSVAQAERAGLKNGANHIAQQTAMLRALAS